MFGLRNTHYRAKECICLDEGTHTIELGNAYVWTKEHTL